MESAALLVLRQQGIERKDIRIFVTHEEESLGTQATV